MTKLNAVPMLLLFLLTGCIVTPGPWRKETYVSNLPSVHNFVPQKSDSNEEYFVGDAYVSIFVRAQDGTRISGKSPYVIYFSILGDEAAYTELTIHDIRIKKNDLTTDDVVYRSGDKSDQVLKTPFKMSRFGSQAIDHIWFTTDPIDVNYESIKKLSIHMDIEISRDNSFMRKTITYSFKRKTKKGFWIPIEV